MSGTFKLQTVAARHSAKVAVVLAAVFSGVWALLEVIVGQLHGAYHVIQIEGCRFAIQLLLMLAIWGHRGGTTLWRTARPGLQIGRAALMLAVPLGFGAAVSQGATMATALNGLWLAPLIALGAARWWLRDRAPLWLWVVTALGLLGTVALLGPARPVSPGAAVIPVLMGLSFALFLAATNRLRHEPVLGNLFLLALGCFVLLLPLMPLVWVTPSLHDAMLFVLISVFGFIALWLLEQALRRWSLSNLAPVLYVHVACLALLSTLSNGRTPTLRLLIGWGLVGLVMACMGFRAHARDRRWVMLPRLPGLGISMVVDRGARAWSMK